jgi:hypothetical protein
MCTRKHWVLALWECQSLDPGPRHALRKFIVNKVEVETT